MKKVKVVVTCEHGGNKIPKEFQQMFDMHQDLLFSHRGYDTGAWNLANVLYNEFGDYFFHSTISRLLIDFNRTETSRSLYSDVTKSLDKETKQFIKHKYYIPYVQAIEQSIVELISDDYFVVHLSVHSFTPVLNGIERNADIGLLYDPRRKNENEFCHRWRKIFGEHSSLRIRMNYPYRGIANGLTTYFRQMIKQKRYAGIELEVNQLLLTEDKRKRNEMISTLVDSFKESVNVTKFAAH